jgi:hypothetical protein
MAAQRQPADQVDVAGRVEREGDAVEAGVAAQQEAVELLGVLVGLAADEGLDQQRVPADHEPAVGGQLVRAGQRDEELPLLGAGVRQARVVQRR